METPSSPEKIPLSAFKKPAVESLTNRELATAVWPDAILQDPEFLSQIERQRTRIDSFKAVTDLLPIGTNITAALEQGLVTEAQVVDLYTNLSNFFEQDPANARLSLYFPFELLPSHLTSARAPELQAACTRFRTAFRTAWEAGLNLHEVRANFDNGDVLEPELLQGDHERVVKATHLIPGFVEQGFMSVTDAITYAETSPDELRKEGIVDALIVLNDKSLITESDIERLKNSPDIYLSHSTNLFQKPKPVEEARKPIFFFTDITHELREHLTQIAAYEPKQSTPARTAWLRKDARERTIKASALKLTNTLLSGDTLPASESLTPEEILVCIDALRQACLRDNTIYTKHHAWLTSLSLQEYPSDVADAFTKMSAHLHAAGIVSDNDLREQGVRIPALAGPFSENLPPIAPFLREVREMTTILETDPYLQQHVYPVTLVFGSQLKGYGTRSADADVAVFIRPGTERREQANLERHLHDVFSHEKIGGKAVMFWLDTTETGLRVHDWEQQTNADGQSSWIHVLFGATWEGDEESITELRHQLLPHYFYDPHTQLQGKPTHERWLEEMERDTLQYRLLHKGFERYYPINSPVNTVHGHTIDGESAFYDPQYRRIATELYLNRIFLPKLSR